MVKEVVEDWSTATDVLNFMGIPHSAHLQPSRWEWEYYLRDHAVLRVVFAPDKKVKNVTLQPFGRERELWSIADEGCKAEHALSGPTGSAIRGDGKRKETPTVSLNGE